MATSDNESMSQDELTSEVLDLALEQLSKSIDNDGRLSPARLEMLASLTGTVQKHSTVSGEARQRLDRILLHALGIANSNLQHGSVPESDLEMFVSLLEITRR